MKPVAKLILYTILIVIVSVGGILLFKNRPEVQLAFLLPGIYIFIYSKLRDEVFISRAMRLRMARGK